MKQKLLVLCGGQSSEHIVSRMSCTSVLNNLDANKYEITLVGIDLDGGWHYLDAKQTDLAKNTWLDNSSMVEDVYGLLKNQDVAFPVLHGMYGEDGTIQGLFELAKLPYVGCRVMGSSVAMDKIYTKKILDTVGVPQVKSVYVKKRYDEKLVVVTNTFDEIEEIEDYIVRELGMPCFIKASRSGSSVGCYRCDNQTELIGKLSEAGKTCIPALVDEQIQEQIRQYAIKVFKAVDGHGLSRVDFFLDKKTNKIYLNEINTMPGFTKISMYPQLMNDFGITYPELLDRLIVLALQK